MADEETKGRMASQIQNMFDRCDTGCNPINGAEFEWSEKGTGFGRLYFYVGDDDKVHCSNELMGKEWIKGMLCQMVDECILDDPSQRDEDE